MKPIKNLAVICSITAVLISGCATQTHPPPVSATPQPVDNSVENSAIAVDQLMDKIAQSLNEQVKNNNIAINRFAADSIRLTFSGSGLFKSGKAELSNDMKYDLGVLVEVLTKHPDNVIHVIGHTDSTGKESWNQKLSEMRANAVTTHMISIGQEPELIISQGLGESSPIADNKDKNGRALNRRIEIYVRNIIPGQESLAFSPPT